MPSNKELVNAIEAAAKAANVEVPETADLKNDKLAEILKDLKGLKAPAAAPAVAKYFVEDGKSLTSKRGIRGPHDSVAAKDIPGDKGAERLEELEGAGVLYKAEQSKPEAKKAAAAKAKAAKAKAAKAKAEK